MLASFIQFAINSILFMVMWHFGSKFYYYVKEKRYVLAKARVKKQIKNYVDKI